ncbi:hypothetical protein PRIPAC_96122 [Pristionchus pacificus]|uniref:Integrator complex subunit 14 C-terminal domain-containing protein n=1 Tax=Pristionchus pacificus TaxID=54126 RepID=A0A2A6B2H2_PRIPA|nr:hypothetical protein PRIPAC_96122 [Pristionchus pacificus]|eukprot:PDM60077.1 hypothetical protein PRIPAC_49363 [Pristionchus pacificus]
MGYLIAVDQSLSMGGTLDGRVRKKINGILEKSRFEIAADIVESLLHCAGRLNVEPVVHLYRIGDTFLNLGEVSSVEDVVTMITKDDGKDVELFGCVNMGRFMAFTHDHLNPTVEDKIIVLTDSSHFQGDVNYGVSCETRFIIVNTNKKCMNPMQLEELDEIAASSVGFEVSPKNESLYHHFFVGDFPSIHELSTSVFDEMFEMSAYTLQMGHMTTQIKIVSRFQIGHTFVAPNIDKINIIGFVRPPALMNMESTGSHFVHPVFYENPVEDADDSVAVPVAAAVADEPESEDDIIISSSSSSSSSDEDLTEIEEEVSDREDDDTARRAREREQPRTSFIPTKALSATDISAHISKSSPDDDINLPDFVPPTKPVAPAPVVAPVEPAVSTAPKRKYKVISRSSGVEKEYIPGQTSAAAAAAAAAPIDIPSPAFEPLEDEKKVSPVSDKKRGDEKRRSDEKKGDTPPPPKKTKIITRTVPKNKKDPKKELLKKKRAAYLKALKIDAARAKRELEKIDREVRRQNGIKEPKEGEEPEKKAREEYDRVCLLDDVALHIVVKSDDEFSEGPWSPVDGEFSDLVMYQKVKDEMNGKTKKEDCEENMKDEEEKTVKVEEGEVKEGEEKMEGEKKVNTTEKKEIEKDEVMKEEKVEERMKDGEKKVEKMDEDDNEGVVTVLPTPFRPSKRARYTRIIPGFTAPYLVQMLAEAMRLEEMFAVCLLDNGEYGVLSYDQNSEGDDLLCFSTIVDQDKMPLIIPHFSQLLSHFDDTNEVDNFYISQQVGENPSYILARSNWTSEEGIEADMVRIRKNLKKAPERISHFYVDVNRMRAHAYCVCMESRLSAVADMIIAEAKDFGALAVKHAEYVATHYRKKVKWTELKEIQIPDF